MEVSSLYTNFSVVPPVPTAPASALSGAVDTVLPQGSQSVAPVGAAAGTGNSTDDANPGNQSQSASPGPTGLTQSVGKFTRDPATNSLVFIEVDSRTQAVIVQLPDEQLLKLRTYLAEMQRREAAAQASNPGSIVTKTT